MGKWTPNYTDNVLNSKISALITGAINRAAVEKEATITYDEFVNELDTGDSFTTSLVDILVKELAERHMRPSQNDERRLIAPRTAERLISLANPRQVYRGERLGSRNHAGRRTYNLAEFMNLPTTELDMDEEENDFGNLLDATTGAAEGARFNTDLFDAYGSNGWPPIPRRLGTTPSPPLEDEPLWRPHSSLSSAGRHSTWGPVPTSSNNLATSLTRHPSIRRPTRRVVDFNDGTARRRPTIRESIGNHGEGSDGNSPFSLGSGSDSSQTVRRFFPTNLRRSSRPSESREDRHREEEGRVYPPGVSMDRPLPRLRRGGVRPPETFYTNRYPWSAPTSSSRPLEQLGTNAHSSSTRSPSLGPSDPIHPLSPQASGDLGIASSELVGYPTPGSIENEPASV